MQGLSFEYPVIGVPFRNQTGWACQIFVCVSGKARSIAACKASQIAWSYAGRMA